MQSYDFRYARILDLTRSEALAILGFPPTSTPTPAKLRNAQRREGLKHHPDRGGDPNAMVDVNRAYDFLMEAQDSGTIDPAYGEEERYYPGDTLKRELEPLKKRGWWAGKNCVVNVTLMGDLNLWYFSILPQIGKAYRPAGDRTPEGLVIDPGWHPFSNGDVRHPTPNSVAKVVSYAKGAEPVSEAVSDDLKKIESTYGVEIPSAIKSKLIADAGKVAKRRWGIDRLRSRKILVPFVDGSKPFELSSWQ
jgi:hypothetical protein